MRGIPRSTEGDLAYTPDSHWRNRDLHIVGRGEIVALLTQKWQRELDYVLRKSLWDFHDNRIAVRFQYEWRDAADQWYRSYGNELWEFTPEGLMSRREASINDAKIDESQRRYSRPTPKIRIRTRHSAVVSRAPSSTADNNRVSALAGGGR